MLLAVTAAFAAAPLDPARPPGVVVDHVPASTRTYVGSPSLARLPDGELVASHDFFGPGCTNDRTAVFASRDGGRTWERRAEIAGQWWSTLFHHRGALYLMGTSREYGYCVLRRSTDGGRSWTEPKDERTGLLHGDGTYHCAPVPVLEHAGRLWRGMEDAMGPGGWGEHFRTFMMSAPVDADLLRADSWISSSRIGRDASWLGGTFGGWLEGNAVAAPDGSVVNVLRVHNPPMGETAALVRISPDGRTATFDPSTGFLNFPGGTKKFTIRHDPRTGLYWSLTNWIPPKHAGPDPNMTRNTLALVSSPDLRLWSVRCVLLYHPDTAKHGFQYVDWLFDGDDIIAASRTAYDDGLGGAHNQHDANYLTFHRFRRFRDLSMRDSVARPDLEPPATPGGAR